MEERQGSEAVWKGRYAVMDAGKGTLVLRIREGTEELWFKRLGEGIRVGVVEGSREAGMKGEQRSKVAGKPAGEGEISKKSR